MKTTFRSFGVAQALMLGLCVGLVVSSASCGTKPPPAKCNRNTCAGCCDDTGVCFETNDAGVQSPEACGLGGVTCQVCTSTQVCAEGQCRLSAAGGGSGGGDGGMTGGGVGGGGGSTGGGTGGGSTGDGGVCNATTCPTGCCNASGGCVAPAMQNFTRCGSGGATCAGCPNGQACSASTDGGVGNVCQVPNCSACLDTSGNCRTDKQTMTDNNYCGANGGVCARCDTTNNQQCMGGRCISMSTQCNSTNCNGCCAGNTCISADAGISNAQCGLNGAVCTTCTSPATCDLTTGNCMGGAGGGGGFPGLDGGFLPGPCDVTTCATGCCHIIAGCVASGTQDPIFGAGITACIGPGGAGDICQFCLGPCGGFCF